MSESVLAAPSANTLHLRELSTADAVVDEDESVIDDPALARCVLARVIELARDRLLLVGHAVWSVDLRA